MPGPAQTPRFSVCYMLSVGSGLECRLGFQNNTACRVHTLLLLPCPRPPCIRCPPLSCGRSSVSLRPGPWRSDACDTDADGCRLAQKVKHRADIYRRTQDKRLPLAGPFTSSALRTDTVLQLDTRKPSFSHSLVVAHYIYTLYTVLTNNKIQQH